MNTQIVATIIAEGSKLITEWLRVQPVKHEPAKLDNLNPNIKFVPETTTIKTTVVTQPHGVSTAETVNYQKHELSKELLLMEKHLQQGCQINGTPCDCCEKHPLVIEALAQETLGMTGDPVYSDLVDWTKKTAPKTTAAAARSKMYTDEYPQMAVEAREMRKKIMGTLVETEPEKPKCSTCEAAVKEQLVKRIQALSPEQKEMLKNRLMERIEAEVGQSEV